jgi:DNA helicase-2/ATP-dependent DNA helicase PcrA
MVRHLEGLNAEQRRAATTTEGPLLVLAGAGTGKTRVVTARIAHLLHEGVGAERVLALTFTNKAAAEMRARVAALVGAKRGRALFAGTFHAFCARTLRAHAEAAGLPESFTIADASDQLAAVRSALRGLAPANGPAAPAPLLARISLLKSRLAGPERALEEAGDAREAHFARVYALYEEHLRRTRTVDFDDLLLFTVRLLSRRARVRDALRARYRYVLVDEYQDTNAPQYEIVRLLGAKHRNVCVVGDDDQSIYGWRGADVSRILGFDRDFPGATVVRLETNYRSTRPILEAANAVIRNNGARHEKSLRAAAGDGPPVRVFRAEDEEREAEEVVRDVCALVQRRAARLGEVAILFRTALQSRPFEAELRRRSIPYVLVGGMSFFDRKEVRDLVAFLRLVANPDDEMSLLRVADRPPRGVGRTALDRVLEHAAKAGLRPSEVLARAGEVEGVAGATADAIARFYAALAGARRPGVAATVRAVIEAVDYRTEVERCYEDPLARQARWAAVEEVCGLAESHERREARPSLARFLEELTLSGEDDGTPEDASRRDALTLMTLHAAKGLEFAHVYLAGVEEGLLPHAKSLEGNALEEERRLLYVGITRARRHLTLTYAKRRAHRGRRTEVLPSRFLFEMRGETPPESWRPWGATPPAEAPARRPPTRPGARRRARRGSSA